MEHRKYITLNIFLILFVLFASTGYLIKAKPLVVLSNSMSPLIKKGDLIVIFENKEYEVNDVISFKNKGGIVTHRVVSKKIIDFQNNPEFKTKGDANSSADFSIVSSKNIIGKVRFIIPLLGFLFMYLQSRYFVYLLTILFIFTLIRKIKNVKR